jgi:hypothetical protein
MASPLAIDPNPLIVKPTSDATISVTVRLMNTEGPRKMVADGVSEIGTVDNRLFEQGAVGNRFVESVEVGDGVLEPVDVGFCERDEVGAGVFDGVGRGVSQVVGAGVCEGVRDRVGD